MEVKRIVRSLCTERIFQTYVRILSQALRYFGVSFVRETYTVISCSHFVVTGSSLHVRLL